MPQVIYMPPDPTGMGNIFGPGIEALGAGISAGMQRKREREEQANRMLMQLMMEYGGTLAPEQMGQIERTMGLAPTPSPLRKIGTALGILPEQPTVRTPLRRIFEPVEGGYKIKGRTERELEKQRELSKIGLEEKKELTKFMTDEEIRGEKERIAQLSGPKREAAIADLQAHLKTQHEFKKSMFDEELDMMSREARARGEIEKALGIERLREELPLRWEMKEKEIRATGQEWRKTEQVKLEREAKKEEERAAKEKRTNYLKTLSNINNAFAKWPGEEVTEDELDQIKLMAGTQGWRVISTPLPKKTIGGPLTNWMIEQPYTFQIVDPETGMPPKIYEEKGAKLTKPIEVPKPTYKYNPATGKLEKQ